MKVSELRIGNWVQGPIFSHPRLGMYSDGIMEIQAFGLFQMAQNELVGIPSILSPIPLTEEWLLKFGFEYIGDDEYTKVINKHTSLDLSCVEHDTVDGQWVGEWNTFIITDDWAGRDCDVIPANMRYVHQFQNLYFALFEKEIEIEPSL